MSGRRLTRRRVLAASGLALLGGAGALALGGTNLFLAAITETVEGAQIDAPTAYRLATEEGIVLIDIRRPEEWAATGSGAGAHRLDMRRPDFLDEVFRLAEGDRTRPIAVICARGVRSARLSNAMAEAGFTNIIDVPEGMIGSPAGPGWIARGLPLVLG